MGGEHFVSFHQKSQDPCNYIHGSKEKMREMIVSEKDLIIWPKIKKEIIWFIKLCYCHTLNIYKDRIQRYLTQIESWNHPKDIYLYWSYKDDNNIIGYMCHDISKLLILAYPGKLCASYDRCQYYEEYPNQEWYMCEFKYAKYEKIPNFLIYKVRDLDTNFKNIYLNGQDFSINKHLFDSEHLTKIITPDYPFDLYYVLKKNLQIPIKIKILMKWFPLEIVNLICQYNYRIYRH